MLAVLERWLPYTVTILDRFHCISSGLTSTKVDRTAAVSNTSASVMAVQFIVRNNTRGD